MQGNAKIKIESSQFAFFLKKESFLINKDSKHYILKPMYDFGTCEVGEPRKYVFPVDTEKYFEMEVKKGLYVVKRLKRISTTFFKCETFYFKYENQTKIIDFEGEEPKTHNFENHDVRFSFEPLAVFEVFELLELVNFRISEITKEIYQKRFKTVFNTLAKDSNFLTQII